MLVTTDAIVLSLQPHSDKAHILHAYTRAGGRVNYRVYGLGRKNPKGLYTPLSLIQITADQTPSKPPTLKEASSMANGQGIGTKGVPDIYQQTVSLFIAEVLYHTLRYPMTDEQLFDFIATEIHQLDTDPNFHLHFLIRFAAKLGFAIPESNRIISDPTSRKARQEALRALCNYYAEHVETWQNPKSLDVLMEVFD